MLAEGLDVVTHEVFTLPREKPLDLLLVVWILIYFQNYQFFNVFMFGVRIGEEGPGEDFELVGLPALLYRVWGAGLGCVFLGGEALLLPVEVIPDKSRGQ